MLLQFTLKIMKVAAEIQNGRQLLHYNCNKLNINRPMFVFSTTHCTIKICPTVVISVANNTKSISLYKIPPELFEENSRWRPKFKMAAIYARNCDYSVIICPFSVIWRVNLTKSMKAEMILLQFTRTK